MSLNNTLQAVKRCQYCCLVTGLKPSVEGSTLQHIIALMVYDVSSYLEQQLPVASYQAWQTNEASNPRPLIPNPTRLATNPPEHTGLFVQPRCAADCITYQLHIVAITKILVSEFMLAQHIKRNPLTLNVTKFKNAL